MSVDKTNWLCEIRAECEQTSIQAVADALGYARCSISLAINGQYRGSTDAIRDKYIAYRRKVMCPHTGAAVDRKYCEAKALRDAPTHNPSELRHWRSCQRCEHKPCRST